MNKSLSYIVLIIFSLISCKNNDIKKADLLTVAKQYYEMLDKSDTSKLNTLIAKRLSTREGDYEVTYSRTEYSEFLKWDATFDPSYEVLEIERQDGLIIATISKLDKRISFLHQKPFITKQTLRFQKDKIVQVETDYVNFDNKTWESNKTSLVDWIEGNHPELNGFIFDMTEKGGLNFLKALALYKEREL